ncbi:MAG TPA: D-2-hydroxyacid dehydrogenase family protein [Acidimicrobiales bacterium]|nr:D-2-hydroxyacid dehydrogenase family protein [Acidimicrobiales bacterium]
MRVTILDDYFDTLRGLPSFRLLDGHEVTVYHDHEERTDALAERLAGTEALVLIRERTPIRGELLDRLPQLQLISQRSVYPHVDVDACTRNGVVLCSNLHADTPSYATAELTWALILASMRQIPQQVASLKAGSWQMGVGRTLRGRTLGLYGYGRIARTVSDYAAAFGMRTWWWASDDGRARAAADGADVAPSRAAFFGESDIVSVHIRLTGATSHVVTRADLAAMRSDAVFVNTSRAGLVEPGALEEALLAGRPGHAAVDVYEVEPLVDADQPFIQHPNLVATPHIGYVTEDEWDLQFTDIYEQINAYRDGRPINVVNPEALRDE